MSIDEDGRDSLRAALVALDRDPCTYSDLELVRKVHRTSRLVLVFGSIETGLASTRAMRPMRSLGMVSMHWQSPRLSVTGLASRGSAAHDHIWPTPIGWTSASTGKSGSTGRWQSDRHRPIEIPPSASSDRAQNWSDRMHHHPPGGSPSRAWLRVT